jgi:hypothetical protein
MELLALATWFALNMVLVLSMTNVNASQTTLETIANLLLVEEFKTIM